MFLFYNGSQLWSASTLRFDGCVCKLLLLNVTGWCVVIIKRDDVSLLSFCVPPIPLLRLCYFPRNSIIDMESYSCEIENENYVANGWVYHDGNYMKPLLGQSRNQMISDEVREGINKERTRLKLKWHKYAIIFAFANGLCSNIRWTMWWQERGVQLRSLAGGAYCVRALFAYQVCFALFWARTQHFFRFVVNTNIACLSCLSVKYF